MPDWRPWIPGLVLGLGCLFTLGLDRQRPMPLARPLDDLPLSIGDRTGVARTVSPEEQAVAGMTSYVYRWYGGAEAPFDIYVGYYDHQAQGKTIHSPRNCLPGAGWEVLLETRVPVPTAAGAATVNRYLLQNNDQRALVYYWYQGRGRVAANEYRVKWELLRDAALRGRTEEALVRVVVRLTPGTSEAMADDWARRATAFLIPALDEHLPR